MSVSFNLRTLPNYLRSTHMFCIYQVRGDMVTFHSLFLKIDFDRYYLCPSA